MSLPKHLSENHAQGLIVNEPIAQYEIGNLKNFVYLILDWNTREAAIVDSQTDLSAPLAALNAHGFRLTKILLTHTHHDHIAGLKELMRAHPDAQLLLHPTDMHRLQAELRTSLQLHPLQDGELFRVGSLEIQALHTPGHSAGESCYFLPDTTPPYLFTGDTVFIRDCGRTDFADGSNAEMFASLQRIKKLPLSSVILPGHHYARECATTVARELRDSPPFRCASVAELEALP